MNSLHEFTFAFKNLQDKYQAIHIVLNTLRKFTGRGIRQMVPQSMIEREH
jgi:hypothetical protein